MYNCYDTQTIAMLADAAITAPVDRYGICVYVNTNPDDIGPDIYIDPEDIEGIAIFREFAAKIAAHHNTLLK